MESLIQQLINGLTIGSIYALVALGYTMVYGIIRLINFAHGEIYMLGAYMTYVAIKFLHLPFLLALVFAVIVCSIIGYMIERVAYRPLRKSSRISALISAIGVSILLQNVVIYIFGADVISFPEVTLLPNFNVGGVLIRGHQILIFVITIVCLVGLQYLVYHTDLGRAMRAVSADQEAASLMGINVNKTIARTFVIGSALAAVAGSMVGVYYSTLAPAMGVSHGLKAFVAAVFGGIGLLPGAVLGGFLIGLIETLFIVLGYSLWREAVVYSILILILVVKPTGLLGKKGGVKV